MNQNLHQLLQVMKNDSEAAESFFRPSPVLWENLSQECEQRIAEGIGELQSSSVNNLFSLLSVTDFPYHYLKCAMWMLYTKLKERDVFGVLENTEALVPPGMNANLIYNTSSIPNRHYSDHKNLTWDYLITVDTILNIAVHCPWILTKPCTIIDLGAGWGRIGYVLTQINKNLSYSILDIPQSLLIAQEYLRNASSVKVYDYTVNREIDIFSKDFLLENPGLRFMGTQDLRKFEPWSVDFFINVASFQEMSLDQVSSYFNLIDEKADYFYTQQRYQDLDMNYDIYPYKKEWKKIFDRDVSFLPLWFEAFFKI